MSQEQETLSREKIIREIYDLRKMIKEHYKVIGDCLYLVTLETDKYLEWLEKGLKKKEENKK